VRICPHRLAKTHSQNRAKAIISRFSAGTMLAQLRISEFLRAGAQSGAAAKALVYLACLMNSNPILEE
jgi:hypothetical protein